MPTESQAITPILNFKIARYFFNPKYSVSTLYQFYLLNSPKLFNKFTMVNSDTT
jgi:hypothetical protein